ncbi:MAG: type VI secretion system membrane subunit TssM, partial [Acetobacteraceae bacterium]|nr:type VI secretion system membrane subunit TssM [Acetobacteraceae bacterium]
MKFLPKNTLRWGLSLAIAVQAALLLWFFGPLLDALEPIRPRLALIVGTFVLWAGVNLALDWRKRRRERALVQGVTEAPVDPAAAAAAEESSALAEKFAHAMTLLRRAHGSRSYLYEQPWYVIIGPPGAGKTTALLNSGLRFPLAAEMGQDPIAGVGGTRLCEWLFADEAVLIDTAGRYAVQDSDPRIDRAGWDSFLDLLKRTRERQPLNGVIVAIPVTDVANASREERLTHARAIRKRLKEIEDRLQVRLPVYAMMTKADLLAGFMEFFDDLDREKRAQVWGTTFPLAQANPLTSFASELRSLV